MGLLNRPPQPSKFETLLKSIATVVFLAVAQTQAIELEPAPLQDFTPGVVTANDPADICDTCAQDASNVNVKNGYVEKRLGSVLQNSSSLGGFGEEIRFLHEYPDGGGEVWLISVTSNSIYRSRNGGVTNTLVTSTFGITSASRFSAVNAFGNAYLTDGTTNWIIITSYSVTGSTAMQRGTINEFFAERLITGGVSGNLSTLYTSARGSPLDWTADAGTDDDAFSTQVRQNDGYRIRAIKRFRQGILVFKDFGIDLFTLSSDGLTFVQTSLSSVVGTQHPESVVVTPNEIIWLAHDGYYSYNGAQITNIGLPIGPDIDSIKQLNDGRRTWAQSSEAEFEQNTLKNVSVTPISGSVVLLATATALLDDFTDDDFTASPAWSLSHSSGNVTASIVSSKLNLTTQSSGTFAQGYVTYGTTTTFTTGSVSFGYTPVDVSTMADVYHGIVILSTVGATVQPTGYLFYLHQGYLSGYGTFSMTKVIAGVNDGVYLDDCVFTLPLSAGTTYTFRIDRNNEGLFDIYKDGVKFTLSERCEDTTYNTFSSVHFGIGTGGSTTTTRTVRFDSISIATHTGSAQSPAFNIGTDITSWGAITLTDTPSGGTLTYAIYGDTNTALSTATASSFVSSQTITSGQIPSIATAAYLTVFPSFSRTVATNTPSVDETIVSWNEGDSTFPVWSMWHDGDILSAVSVDSATANDQVFVYDENHRWTFYRTGLPIYCMTRYKQQPYFGANDDGDIVRFQAAGVYDDYDGDAINSYWISKEFDFGYPLTNKLINRYYVTMKYRANDDATFEWGVNRGSLTSDNSFSSVTNGALDLDANTGFFRKNIQPQSMTYKKGLSHRFKISNAVAGDRFDLLSVTLKADLETSP